MNETRYSNFFKKADAILLAVILALSVLGFVVLRKTASADSVVEVTVAGSHYASYPLFKDGEYKIAADYGYNTIVIESGQVWVKEADCPNKDCMHFGKMNKEGQVILCLPHKLAVRIIGLGEGGSDAISY